MKFSLHVLCLALLACSVARAQDQTMGSDDPNNPDTPPAGATVITSDELRMDKEGTSTAVFTGNVVVVGSNFHMTCEEMTVYFTPDSKIDNILAKGNVVIVQPGRVTHCGQAHYFRDDDKFVLTEEPDILDETNEISAPEITIFRTKQSLLTQGRTRTTIRQKMGPTGTPDATGAH